MNVAEYVAEIQNQKQIVEQQQQLVTKLEKDKEELNVLMEKMKAEVKSLNTRLTVIHLLGVLILKRINFVNL